MRVWKAAAAGLLGAGFGWVSYVLLFVEPGMGFTETADFFDREKVAAGYTSLVWSVSSVVYMLFLPALWVLARSSDAPLVRWSGIAAGVLFLVVGAVDRVGIQLPTLLPTRDAVLSSVAAVLPVRFALLKSAVVTLGVFAWGTTREALSRGAGDKIWRGFGWLTLLLSVGFVFVFNPAPIAFFLWGTVLAVRSLRGSAGLRA
jgi:hypothetical protein